MKSVGTSAATFALIAGALYIATPAGLADRLLQFPYQAVALIAVWQVVLSLLISTRFWRILSHFSVFVSWGTALRATIMGQIASLVAFPLVGQIVGRHRYLVRSGLPSSLNAVIAGYERGATALVSLTCALCASVYLSQSISGVESVAFSTMLATILLGVWASISVGTAVQEKILISRVMRYSAFADFFEVLGITLLSYCATIVCFVVAFKSVAPQLDYAELMAIAAVVSFAASLPISVGGWGLREVASVFMLGKFGVSADAAMAASVVVGLVSNLSLFFFAPVLFSRGTASQSVIQGSPLPTSRHHEVEVLSAWGIGFFVSVLVFFQVYVSAQGGVVNINLADPVALLALAVLALEIWLHRSLPVWRAPAVNRALLVCTCLLGVGLIHGFMNIGVTQWALVGRFVGWFVLLGYLGAGYLMVSICGALGLRRFRLTLITMTALIIVVTLITRFSALVFHSREYFQPNFQGFAQNRNAFAFQMLCVMSLILGYGKSYGRLIICAQGFWGQARFYLLAATPLFGIFMSGSRAGIVTTAITAVAAAVMKFVRWRPLVIIFLLSLLGLGIMWGVDACAANGCFPGSSDIELVSKLSTSLSDNLRWAADKLAFRMWLDAPFLGVGLGVFIKSSQTSLGETMVVHNTLLWILSEFGLLGLIVLAAAILPVGKAIACKTKFSCKNRSLLLLALAFSVFCQFHEVSYQRILWFVLGGLLAGKLPNKWRLQLSDRSS
jgi:hypothetical protein